MKVLAIVARFKSTHTDYLHALAERVDLSAAWSGEGHAGTPDRAAHEGLPIEPIGRIGEVPRDEVKRRLAALIEARPPDVVHVMYYNHEELVLMARELAGERAAVVCETRDTLTTLTGAQPGSPEWNLEAAALQASDAQVFVTAATRAYLESAHALDLQPTSIIVPHAFARRNVAPPVEKLSARDGRVHIALVGTAADQPGDGRWYGDIIRRLVAQGLVVHSHFHELDGVSLEPYRSLAAELPDYHAEPTVPYRWDSLLSDLTSQYDLMGVFHELEADHHNESATLAMALTTKAVSGWLHGGIPVVCTTYYKGIIEQIEEHRIGFAVESIDDVWRVAADRDEIERATAACLAVRGLFTHEHQASRLEPFYRAAVAARNGHA